MSKSKRKMARMHGQRRSVAILSPRERAEKQFADYRRRMGMKPRATKA